MAGYRGASEAVILGLNVTLAKPAGVVSGDVLVAGIYRSTNADAVTAPAGWSLVDSIAHGGGELAIYSKVAGGAEPTSYVWTWPSNNRGGAGLIALTGASGNIVGLPTETTGTGNAPAPPDSGTVTSGDHVAIVIAGQEGKATSRFTPPTGYTEAADSGSTGGGGDASHGGIGIAYELLTAATQATPDDFASTISAGWVCQTLLVEAAAPAADRAARVTWVELEAPDASRAARVTWAELESPDPPVTDRAARVTWAELEAPDASRSARVTWAELETPSSGFRAARLIWAVLRAPSPLPTGVGAPPNEHGAELFVTVEDVTTGARWDLTQWDVGQWDQAGQPVALAPRLISLASRIGRARTTDPHRASSLSVQVDGRDYITRGFEPMRDVSVRFSPATGQAAQFAFTGKLQAVQDLLSPVRLPRATMQAAGPLGTLARAKITGLVVDPGTAATPAARAQAILDDLQLDGLTLAGWPATPALYTGDSLIGENALGALRAAAAAAQGSPWVTPDGASLEFLQDWPTPGATPIEVGAGELLDPSQVQTDYSVRNVANYVTGSSPDPAVADYAAQDVISQGLYEVATASLEVPVTSAAALAAVVNRRLAISKQARREVLGVQVPILSPATAQAALAVELGDVLHVVYRDAQDPAVHFDLYVRVEGIEHSVKTQNRVRSWVVTFRTDEARTEAGDLWTP